MKKVLLPILCILLMAAAALGQSNKPLLMRNPTLSKTHIVFSYAGDLWMVSRDGGDAAHLTNGIGNEYNPFFSPDGRWIAFTGEYDGNTDVYVMPANGGLPRRLTYHPGNDTGGRMVPRWQADSLCVGPRQCFGPLRAPVHDRH
jgi:tricorn protease